MSFYSRKSVYDVFSVSMFGGHISPRGGLTFDKSFCILILSKMIRGERIQHVFTKKNRVENVDFSDKVLLRFWIRVLG